MDTKMVVIEYSRFWHWAEGPGFKERTFSGSFLRLSKVARVANTEQKIIPSKFSMEHLEMDLLTDVQQLKGEPIMHAPLSVGTEVGHFTGTAGTIGCYVRKTGSL